MIETKLTMLRTLVCAYFVCAYRYGSSFCYVDGALEFFIFYFLLFFVFFPRSLMNEDDDALRYG